MRRPSRGAHPQAHLASRRAHFMSTHLFLPAFLDPRRRLYWELQAAKQRDLARRPRTDAQRIAHRSVACRLAPRTGLLGPPTLEASPDPPPWVARGFRGEVLTAKHRPRLVGRHESISKWTDCFLTALPQSVAVPCTSSSASRYKNGTQNVSRSLTTRSSKKPTSTNLRATLSASVRSTSQMFARESGVWADLSPRSFSQYSRKLGYSA